ncbi:MAG: hypothetical protein GY711_22825 [bacterium]|nr:hypothetical protein [bacterium]
MSANPAFVPGFGNGQGNLCLGLPIVRLLTGPGSILNSGVTGSVERQVDLPTLPRGVVVQPGDTLRFQYWTRDGASNNTSSAVAVTFR